MKKIILIIVVILAVVGLLYYLGPYQKREEIKEEENGSEPVGVPNPASVYCLEQGGELEAFAFESGEDAYCVFEDGSVCWEWSFYNGDCDKGQLRINILEEGEGRPAELEDMVFVHYTGTLLDGTQFDSSLDKEEPFSFVLGADSVILGWEQGVLGIRVGEKRELILGPELAYGEYGTGGIIPPNANLIFEVELLEIL